MMTVGQLLTPVPQATWRAYGVTALQSLGLQPQNWAAGSIASSFLTVASYLLAGLSTQLSNAIAQQWNPTASGGGLQLLSLYFYNVQAPQGTFASGQVTLTNSGGGVYSYAAGQAFFASTIANAAGVYPTYTNEDAFTLNPSSTITIDVECTFLGSGGNAPAGFVTELVTAMLGVTCTNAYAILGSDPLTDPALRQLNIDSLGKNSDYGPRSAYAYAIQTATNIVTGAPVNINRWTISIDSHTGDVSIYICGPEGTTDPNDQAGVAACIESGQGSTDSTFYGARPGGVTVGPATVTIGGFTIGSPAPASTVTYAPGLITVYVLAPKGTTTTSIQLAIIDALDTWFEGPTNPIGGISAADDQHASFTGIFESGITGIIAQAVASVGPDVLMLSTRFAGSGDLAIGPYQVAVNGITASPLNPSTVVVNIQYTGS